MKTLLILDSIRGDHSTGVAVIPRNGETKIAKNVGDPYLLFETKAYDKAMMGINRAIIGHNRFGTQGKLTKANAHPFDFDTLVGAHNGTLTSKHRLKDPHLFDVDSQNLFHHIEMEGLESAMENLAGAWSLVWWDKIDESINFLRNKERPMFLTRNKENNCLFWASEEWMLRAALPRNGINIQDIVETEVDTHISFKINQNGFIEKAHLSKMESKHVPFVTAPTYTVYRNGAKEIVSINGGNRQLPNVQSHGNVAGDDTSKKEQPLPQQQQSRKILSLTQNASYVGSKNVRLEILGQTVDGYGASFYYCRDKMNPQHLIRLYIKNGDMVYHSGEDIFADIGSQISEPKNGAMYFKVQHSSVRLCVPRKEQEKLFEGHDGAKLSLSEWLNKYNECAYCTGWVDPEKKHGFTFASGDAVCHECLQDENISNYMRLR